MTEPTPSAPTTPTPEAALDERIAMQRDLKGAYRDVMHPGHEAAVQRFVHLSGLERPAAAPTTPERAEFQRDRDDFSEIWSDQAAIRANSARHGVAADIVIGTLREIHNAGALGKYDEARGREELVYFHKGDEAAAAKDIGDARAARAAGLIPPGRWDEAIRESGAGNHPKLIRALASAWRNRRTNGGAATVR